MESDMALMPHEHVHYGSNKTAECGANDAVLTMVAADVSCPTCRGWLPIVAPELQRYIPVPVPRGDGRHDIGDDVRAAIVERLTSEWSLDPDLTPEKVRQLAMWAGASVRALIHELGTLRDLVEPKPTR